MSIESNALAAPAPAAASRLASALPLLAVLAAVVLWGGSFAAMKGLVAELGPWSVMWLRMAVALAVLLPLAPRLRPAGYRPGDWRKLAPMVALQPCLYFLLEANALIRTSSAQAGVIAASVPLLVGLGAFLFLGERLRPARLAGLVAATAGVAWLTMQSVPTAAAADPLLGNLMEVGAMACAAASMLLLKDLARRYPPLSLTALQILAGFLFFLPGAPAVLARGISGWSAGQAAAGLYLGAGVTLGAFGLYNWGLSRLPASRASACINLVPVVAVAIGWLALGEGLGPGQLAAAGLVLTGVIVSQDQGEGRRP